MQVQCEDLITSWMLRPVPLHPSCLLHAAQQNQELESQTLKQELPKAAGIRDALEGAGPDGDTIAMNCSVLSTKTWSKD